MRIKQIIYMGLFTAFLLSSCKGKNEQTIPVRLRTEYLIEPIGLDTHSPRFTWEYSGDEKGFTASRYEIRIGTAPGNLHLHVEEISLKPHTRYYWNVTVWDGEGRQCVTSETATFETAKFAPSDWEAIWITDRHDKEFESAPLFRKNVSVGKEVQEARIYVASAGYHELFINGERVGGNYLDPGFTQFDKRLLYVTHDVTSLLNQGENVLSAVLGNGWYNEQSVAVWKIHEATWRSRPRLLCELRITYTDGTTEVFGTDETWKTATGAYIYNNLYSGDKYDARLEESGWKTTGFDDSHWEIPLPSEAPAPQLVAQQIPGIHITEELKPVSIRQLSEKSYLYSFAKNISGFCRLTVKGEAGTRITLKHGEMLGKDGRLDQSNINIFYEPVKPDEIIQTDVFILKGTGEEESFMPSFTYHGFQYVEVESDRPIILSENNLTAMFIHTDVPKAGSFTCSNPLLNKIWDATMLSYLGNLHSIPTDCPQREKNGWTADAHVAIDLGLLGFDGITVYEKWMNDLLDTQKGNGEVSGIIPFGGGEGYSGVWPGPVWDAVLFVIPNALYNYYGESRSIEYLYPAMERYLEYLETMEKEGGFLPFGLGDWEEWKSTTDNEYTSTAYYYWDNMLMARFATLLGKDAAPYRQKAKSLKAAINNKFFHSETNSYAEGTQTAQALALYMGLVPEGREQAVADKLHGLVSGNNYFLDFGLIGCKTVPAMLTKYGYVEDAMRMVSKTEAPSWGYWVKKMGYTTLAETWTPNPAVFSPSQSEDGKKPSSNASLNHVFLGDVSAWMMNQLAGINYDASAPGFRHILITPHFVKDLDWVKGEYHSVRGRIASEWKRGDGKVTLIVTVPADCSADIIIGNKIETVSSGTHTLSYPD